MPDAMHLTARFLHVTAVTLWIGYLATLAMVVLPAARGGQHASNLGPVLQRLGPMRAMGVLVFLFGAWLVTASGHSWSQLGQAGWGHAVSGSIALWAIITGLEHGMVLPSLKKGHQAVGEERATLLRRGQQAALVATLLGIAAVLLMTAALLGGFV
ncbi:MAG: hypothetical protein R3185_07180 [Candidatus Thermoplasmatota archaeon]|nr:hypothetical protein [Candidatus Thermoplasmatota archaeon]